MLPASQLDPLRQLSVCKLHKYIHPLSTLSLLLSVSLLEDSVEAQTEGLSEEHTVLLMLSGSCIVCVLFASSSHLLQYSGSNKLS